MLSSSIPLLQRRTHSMVISHSDSDDDYHSDSDSKLKSALRRRLQHKAIEQNICPAEADLQVLMLYVSQSVLHVQIAVRLRRTYVLKHILVFDV